MLILKRILAKIIDLMIKNTIYGVVFPFVTVGAMVFGMFFTFFFQGNNGDIFFTLLFGFIVLGFLAGEIIYEVVVPVKKNATISLNALGICVKHKKGKSLILPLLTKYIVGTTLPAVFVFFFYFLLLLSNFSGSYEGEVYLVITLLIIMIIYLIDFVVLLITKGKQTLVDKVLRLEYDFKEVEEIPSNIVTDEETSTKIIG